MRDIRAAIIPARKWAANFSAKCRCWPFRRVRRADFRDLHSADRRERGNPFALRTLRRLRDESVFGVAERHVLIVVGDASTAPSRRAMRQQRASVVTPESSLACKPGGMVRMGISVPSFR